MKKEQYIITFDLHTDKNTENKLKKEENKSLSAMYSDINKHMIENSFNWKQGSTYVSNEKIYLYELNEIIDELFNKNKYLTEYVRDITNGIIKEINLVDFDKILEKYHKKYIKDKYFNEEDIKNYFKNKESKNTIKHKTKDKDYER